MIFRNFYKLLPFLMIGTMSVFGQVKPTAITYKYHKKMLPMEPYWFKILRPLRENAFGENREFSGKFISSGTIGDSCITKYEFSIPDVTCASLPDLFGHEIVILPGDNVVVHIGDESKSRKIGPADQFVRQWGHDLSYSGSNNYSYSLFDSLAIFSGDLRNGSMFRYNRNDPTLDSFCKSVEERYLSRLQYLDQYSQKHSIPAAVQQLVKAEIYSSYLINLLVPLTGGNKQLSDYPAVYANIIKDSRFDDEKLYFKTILYSLITQSYYRWEVKSSNTMGISPLAAIVTKYDWIKNNYNGQIREHQIAAFINNYAEITAFTKSVDSLVSDFSGFAINENYIKFLDQHRIAVANKKELTYTLSQAMAAEVTNAKNEKISVSSLLRNKPVVFIFWASWCKPCINELPYENKLEKEFGSKIDFVYLSFDSSASDWVSKSNELSLTHNSYLVTNHFKSDLARYYKMNSIPQYIIYNKEGKQIDGQGLRPSDVKFGTLLADLIK